MKKRILSLLAIIIGIVTSLSAQVDLKILGHNQAQCDTAGTTTLYFGLQNAAGVPLNSGTVFNAHYRINGGAVVTESFTTTSVLNSGDSAVFHFAVPFRFNQFTTYNCEYFTDHPSELNTSNDTAHFTRTFHSLPGYGNHSSDTAVCQGNPANLMMELTGNSPWLLTIVMGADTITDLPVVDPILATQLSPDSTTHFTLLWMTDVNGCYQYIGQGITITVGYPFEVALGADTTICAGQTLTLDAGFSGSTYHWWNGSTSQTLSADTSDWAGALGNQTAWVEVNNDGCIDHDSISINWVVCPDGMNENPAADFNLYPNPSQGRFTVDFSGLSGTVVCEIMNRTGQSIYSETFTDIVDHSVRECYPGMLSNGIYFVVLHNSSERLVKKLVVE